MNFIKCVAALGLSLALAACGGGGGSAGTPLGGVAPSPAPGASAAVAAADFVFELDKTTIVNSGSDLAVLKVTVLDANRNTLSGAPVSVAVDSNGVFGGSSGTSTDTSGQYSGNMTIGGDKSNRTINASITVNGITKVAAVTVTGSQIGLTPVPATPTPGSSITLNLSTTDALGAAIPNVDLVLSGSAGATGTVKTDGSGTASVTFSAPNIAGTYTMIASGLNVSTTKNIQVIAAGAGTIPSATGPVSSASLNPSPTAIATNSAGSEVNRSKLSARFLTTGNSGIENMRVRFEIVPPLLANGESISTGTATVYSDASGTAEAYYIAGTRSSPTNGVVIRACYSLSDFASATDCPNSVSANLTVNGTPLSISISDNNTLQKGLGGISYLKQFLIQVNDSSGVAVKDAVVSASVDITHFGKGATWDSAYRNVAIPTIRDIHSDFTPLPVPLNATPSLQPSTDVPAASESLWCINEDWNRNGFLDTGEDRNSDGVIQPRKAEIVVSYVSGNKTDANGQLLLQVSYGQNMGGWLAYTLRATTNVAGSEGDASKSYVTDVLQTDIPNGSFLTPPFGAGSCIVAN